VPTIVSQALVIRQWDFSETSQTVSLFCREHGVVRGLAKGSRREKSRFSGGLDPLTRGEIVAILKPSVELATLTEWDLQEIFWSTRRSLGAHRAGLYIVDLIHHTILAHDAHPRLWDHTLDALRAIADESAREEAVLRFQWNLLVEIGYKPNLTLAADPFAPASDGGREGVYQFNPRAGGLVGQESATSNGSEGEGLAVGRVMGGEVGGRVGGRVWGEVWRVRPDTVKALRGLEAETAHGREASIGPVQSARRASRLLSEYLRVLLDRDLPTREALFGPRTR